MPLKQFLTAKKGMPWTYRIKVIGQEKPTQWSSFLVSPKDGYLESYTGHLAITEIEYVEINPFESKYMGRMEQDKRLDHSEDILWILSVLKIPCVVVDENIRIELTSKAEVMATNSKRPIVKFSKSY